MQRGEGEGGSCLEALRRPLPRQAGEGLAPAGPQVAAAHAQEAAEALAPERHLLAHGQELGHVGAAALAAWRGVGEEGW